MKIINQSGRSMVEMLGVLAIVGVLSVGAIAGYSKAMFKYKMNKTMDIISHAVARVAELDTMNLGTEISGSQDAINYGILPNCETIIIEETENCSLPLGGFDFDFSSDGPNTLHGIIYLRFTQEPFDSCVAFLNSGIYKNVAEDWWTIGGQGTHLSAGTTNLYSPDETNNPLRDKISDITTADILEACNTCKNATYCQVEWTIRGEI